MTLKSMYMREIFGRLSEENKEILLLIAKNVYLMEQEKIHAVKETQSSVTT